MPNDLSPICKALIALLASATKPMSLDAIREVLPDADPAALQLDLHMLVRATVVRCGICHVPPQAERGTLYWLAGSNAAAGHIFIDRSAELGFDVSMADVGEVRLGKPIFFTGDHDFLKAECVNRRFTPVTVLPTATDLLSRAAKHMADRAATYDKVEGERSMGATVAAFNAITSRDLSEAEGWLLMQLLKDVRLFQRPGYHADSAEDAVAYTALMAEARARDTQEVDPAAEVTREQ